MDPSHTTEYSFIVKPSEHGVGVFATHEIKKGAHLRLFGDEETFDLRVLERKRSEVPDVFREYCLDRGDTLYCPHDFGRMEIGWYLNHSKTPNATRDKDYKWYALRDIQSGEEITIDYNSLEEPEGEGQEYYRKETE